MKKLLHIIGTRPQIIKLASMLKSSPPDIINIVIDTNQHYENSMQRNLYEDFKINTESIIFLKNEKSLSNNVSAISNLITHEIQIIEPDIVLVYGDTYTTLAGALSAKNNKIKSIHIEAGLRSFSDDQIEETNRILADNICDYLFCPTQTAIENLQKEGLGRKAYFTGDIMLDIFLNTEFKKIKFPLPENYYLATLHRSENIENKKKLESIFQSFRNIPNLIIPLHHSLKDKLNEYDLYDSLPLNIKFLEPLTYSEILHTISQSKGVITDSGGLQKDSFWLNKPTLTLRTNTEWVETLQSGGNILVNNFPANLFALINSINIIEEDKFSLFGNGSAVKNIMSKIREINL